MYPWYIGPLNSIFIYIFWLKFNKIRILYLVARRMSYAQRITSLFQRDEEMFFPPEKVIVLAMIKHNG